MLRVNRQPPWALDGRTLDSDGEDMSLESVVSQLLELVMTLVEHPRLSGVLANGLNDTVGLVRWCIRG